MCSEVPEDLKFFFPGDLSLRVEQLRNVLCVISFLEKNRSNIKNYPLIFDNKVREANCQSGAIKSGSVGGSNVIFHVDIVSFSDSE